MSAPPSWRGNCARRRILPLGWATTTAGRPATIGVINAFHGIATSGSGGLGAISGGISEALVKTALGLIVAIPAVWLYNYFAGRLEYLNVEMANSSSELVDYFIKKSV